ncbi:hypothetical protein Zm00014a_028273 [Zea mays]|uniref:Uncharacterized protein n=1 Tax=Zea mays TaxID=4577 RepID=A0A3L6F3Z8_MAIZE|nr:hypothetical protein Zm00014a_028273 [Zea mays]
MGKCWTRSKQH